jgi:hypothetical protein
MALREDPGGEIVARSEMPREWIASQPTCQSFVFDPIPNSAGKHAAFRYGCMRPAQ